jgi:hypothetical protein
MLSPHSLLLLYVPVLRDEDSDRVAWPLRIILAVLARMKVHRWKKKLFSEQGRVVLEKLSLAPWASRRRQELLELLDRMNPMIEELTAAVEREAKKRP